MKTKSTFAILLILLSISINAQSIFKKSYYGPRSEYGKCVQQTNDGGFIIAGYTLSFGAGEEDGLLIKTDSDGAIQWSKTYGMFMFDAFFSVQQTMDEGYIITGTTQNYSTNNYDLLVIKTDSSGDIHWSKRYDSSSSDEGSSVIQTDDGGYIISGNTQGANIGNFDMFLIKTDVNGEPIWTKAYGGSGKDIGYNIQQTTDDGYIITGYTHGARLQDILLVRTDLNGDLLWSKTYGGTDHEKGYSVQQTSDGGFIVVGYTKSFGAGLSDIFIIKTESGGDLVWSKAYGSSSSERGYSIEEISNGEYIVLGKCGNATLLKTDSNGNLLWYKIHAGPEFSEKEMFLQKTKEGGYAIVGDIQNGFNVDNDLLFLKTDYNGNIGCTVDTSTIFINSPNEIDSTVSFSISSYSISAHSYPLYTDNITIADSVFCSSIGIQEYSNQSHKLEVFPNPFSNSTTLEFENPKKENHTLIIFNSSGQVVRQIKNITDNKVEIEKGNLKDGLYLLQLRKAESIVGNLKVVVQNE